RPTPYRVGLFGELQVESGTRSRRVPGEHVAQPCDGLSADPELQVPRGLVGTDAPHPIEASSEADGQAIDRELVLRPHAERLELGTLHERIAERGLVGLTVAVGVRDPVWNRAVAM